MKRLLVSAGMVILAAGLGASGVVAQGARNLRETLIGYEEVPAVSTRGEGRFQASISHDETSIAYELSYSNLEGAVAQSHIHFGQRGVNGGISVFLCSNLGNGPAGTQACPPAPATIRGTIVAANVIGPGAQGIVAGEFGELLRAIRAGQTYVNVHSSVFPGGEIRAQIERGNEGRGHDGRGGDD